MATAEAVEEVGDEEFDDVEELKQRLVSKANEKGEMNLESLVAQATWKEMLLDLVVSEQLDPWNIDLVVITSKYLERVRTLQTLDLHIPANLILAAAILLRFKSDALRLEEEEQVVEDATYIEEDRAPVEIPVLSLKTRIPPKRKVSLDELVNALEEVFAAQKKREELAAILPDAPPMVIQLPKFDIEEKMKNLMARVHDAADEEGLTTFSSLLKERTREEMIETLLPLLFLSQDRFIKVFQEKYFEEIFVQILPPQEAVENAKKGEDESGEMSKKEAGKLKRKKRGEKEKVEEEHLEISEEEFEEEVKQG